MASSDSPTFAVGKLVKVEARTWPGINKHGGVGRITRVLLAPSSSTDPSDNASPTAVDVQYVLGGREKSIPVQYVHLEKTYDSTAPVASLRDRSMLLGRCKHCGSLRADCGSCDWRFEQQRDVPVSSKPRVASSKSRRASRRARASQQKLGMLHEGDESSSGSSSDDSLLLPLSHWKKRHEASNRKIEHQLNHDSDSSSSSSSNDDDAFLSALRTSRSLQRNLAVLHRLERETSPKKQKPRRLVKKIGPPSEALVQPVAIAQKSAMENVNSPQIKPSEYHMSDDDEAFPTVDDDEIGDADMTQALGSSPLSGSQIPRISTVGEASPVPEGGGGGYQGDEMLMENDLGGFIQPEGAATSLPRGEEDKTANLAFVELPAFFDDTINHIQTSLPKAHVAFADIQRRVETRKAALGSNFGDLEKEGWELYDSMKQELLLNGLDQCRAMFRRLNSRKEFRKHAPRLSAQLKRQFGESARGTRDIRFDQADQDVEDFLRETRRYLLYELKSSRDDELYGEAESSAEDDELSHMHDLADKENDHQQPFQECDKATRSLPQFDPHMHASRVRRKEKRSRRSEKSDRRKRRQSVHQHRDEVSSSGDSEESFIVDPVTQKRKRRPKVTNGDKLPKCVGQRSTKSKKPSREQTSAGFQNENAFDGVFNDSSYGQRSLAPALETLFAPQRVDAKAVSSQSLGSRASSLSAGERMQAFLDANTQNVHKGLNADGQPLTRHHHGSQVTRTGQDETSIGKGGRVRVGKAVAGLTNPIASPVRPTDEVLFQALANSDASTPSAAWQRSEKVLSSLRVLRSSCKLLPHQEEILCRVNAACKAGDAVLSGLCREDALSVFSLAHGYLLKNAISLQEHVATDDLRLSRHVEVLAGVLELIGTKVHERLEQGDGVVFDLFSGLHPCPFVQTVTLQLIDVLLAFFNPKSWAMEGRLRDIDVLRIFAPLRDSLSAVVPLFELCGEYLFSRVECQQWWKSQDGFKCFVSSVSPSSLRTVLKTAKTSKAATVRMKQFGSKFPRVEVNAMWCFVAFLAGANVQLPAPKSKSRWRLLYTMMCCETGVLPKSLEDAAGVLNANKKHTERCENELGYLTVLISRGAMHPLDETGKVIGLFLKRSILLQSRSIGSEKFSNLFNLDKGCLQKEFVLSQWEASALSSETAVEAPSTSDFSKYFCPCSLLGEAESLLGTWVRHTEEKRVLWTQFSSTIRTLLDVEPQISNAGNRTPAGSECFAKAFAPSGPSFSNFVRAANIHFLSVFDVIRNECAKSLKKPIISRELLTKRWAQIATPEMKLQQHALLAAKSTSDAGPLDGSVTMMQCYTGIRTFSMYVLPHLEPSRIPAGTSHHQYVLHFSIACIFSSLQCMCSSISQLTARTSQASRSVDHMKMITLSLAMINRICLSCRALPFSDDNASCTSLQTERNCVGRSILELGGKALRDCLMTVLSLAGCEGAEHGLRMCLAAIRCVSAYSAETLNNYEFQTSMGDEEFGDVDDSLFLAIGSSTEYHDKAAEILCRTIRRLLDLGDPNTIYTIDSNATLAGEFSPMDSRGIVLLSKFTGGLCSCLASLLAVSRELHDMSNIIIGPDFSIASYKRDWSFALLSEICMLSRHHASCKSFLMEVHETAILCFLHLALDANTIERFPTCDRDTLMALSGEQARRKEGRQLNLVNNPTDTGIGIKWNEEIDEVGPAYVSNNLWRLFQQLGNIDLDAGPLCGFLASTDQTYVIQTGEGAIPISMELECLRRIRLLIGFFDVRVAARALQPFEDTLLAMVISMLSNLLQISEGLSYHISHRFRSTTKKTGFLSHKHGRLSILQACYVEMFVSFFSSVILKHWERLSEPLRAELKSLREVLFFSMTQNEEIACCIERYARKSMPSRRSRNHDDVAMVDLCKCLRFACIRRCRETTRQHLACGSIADGQRGAISLVASIRSLANEATIPNNEIIRYITSGFQTAFQPTLETSTSRPLIQCYTDTLVFHNSKGSDTEEVVAQREAEDTGIRSLRRFLLTKVIPPRLLRENQSHTLKASLIELANALLHIELEELKTTSPLTVDDIIQLHGLLRSSWETLRQSLASPNSSADMMALTFRCFSLILVLPFSDDKGKRRQPLLVWCQSVQSTHNLEGETSRLDLFSCYLLALVRVVFRIANATLSASAEARAEILTLILKSALQPSPESSSRDAVPLEQSLVLRLLKLNDALLALRNESSLLSKNVYMKRSKDAEKYHIVSERFEPSACMKREAENLVAVVDATQFTI